MEGLKNNTAYFNYWHTKAPQNGVQTLSSPPFLFNNKEKKSNNSVQDFDGIKPKEDPVKRNINSILKNHNVATAVGVAILSPIVIFLSKGKINRNLAKILTKGVNRSNSAIDKLKYSTNLSKLEMLYLNTLQKTTKVLRSARGTILQITPLKDVLFAKAINKLKLGKFGEKITDFFQNTAIKMTNNKYKHASETFSKMKTVFEQTNKSIANTEPSKIVEINGISKSIKEWSDIAGEKVKKIDSSYDFFRPKAVEHRQKSLISDMTGLGDKIFDLTYRDYKGFLSTPKRWTTFISEDLVSGIKMKFKKEVFSTKKLITNTSNDFSKDVSNTIGEIESSIDMTHNDSIDILKKTKKIVGKYKLGLANNKDGISKKQALDQMDSIIERSYEIMDKSSQYTPSNAAKIQEALQYIKNAIQEDSPGEIEELLNIYKHILPQEKYNEIQKIAQKSTSKLNDAVSMETDRFVDKLRDLKAGSALTDVANGLLIPSVSTGIGVASADTKEKKRSVFLKLGIPLLVGVGVSTVGTVALLSAGPSMVLGLTSSVITGKACSYIDKQLKKSDNKNKETKV